MPRPSRPPRLQIFVLSGQSNAQGLGTLSQVGKDGREVNGTLRYLANDQRTAHLVASVLRPNGTWSWRDDVTVWTRQHRGGPQQYPTFGPLTVGFGRECKLQGYPPDTVLRPGMNLYPGRLDCEAVPTHCCIGSEVPIGNFGPELAFGHVVADALEQPVLIVKSALGSASLAKAFRPPSRGGDGNTSGWGYTALVRDVRTVLSELPQIAPRHEGHELRGFAWVHGFSDGASARDAAEYGANLRALIRDLRRDLGAAQLPAVVAVAGQGGRAERSPHRLKVAQAQLGVANDTDLMPVRVVDTRPFWREPRHSPQPSQKLHWGRNAESMMLIGNGVGLAMLEMLRDTHSSPRAAPRHPRTAVRGRKGR